MIRICETDKNNKKICFNKNMFNDTSKYNENEYYDVFNKKKEYLFSLYNDNNGNKLLAKLKTLLISDNFKKYIEDNYDSFEIFSLNEYSYNFATFLIKNKMNVLLIGDIWKYLLPIEKINLKYKRRGKVFELYAEGNKGLSIYDKGKYKNVFPFKEYELMEKIYLKLVKTNKIYNKKLLNKKEINLTLLKMINNGKPFMVSRIGNTESHISKEMLDGLISTKWKSWLFNTSGFCINKIEKDNKIDEYARLTINDLKNTDIILKQFESTIYLINKYINKNSIVADWYNLYEDADNSYWLSALKRKNVLIITNFNETIKLQIKNIIQENKKHLFKKINFIYLNAPYTVGIYGKDKSWFNIFKELINNIKKINFDIALISAGAYGHPIAAEIKKMKKQSINLCSGLYPIFRVKTKTQSIISRISKKYDDTWIFSIEKKPEDYLNIENGAYWG